MPLVLTDDEKMLREAAQGFVEEKAPVSALRELRDSENAEGFSRDLWKEMAQMGWAGIIVPEEHGGSEFGLVGAGLIAEELGRHLSASPYLTTAIMAATAFTKVASAEQAAAHLPGLAAGETLFALAVDETRKHGPKKTALKAERSGNGFKLNGTKTFVVDGHVADQLIIAARTSGEPGDEAGITLFLTDANSTGITRERTEMVDARNSARINFKDVELNADAVIGEVDQGYAGLETILNAGRAVLAAEMTGSAKQAFDITMEYIRERKQFGVAVGSFQALQHRAAHLHTELEIAEAATLSALQAIESDSDGAGQLVALAKAKVGQVSLLAAQEGVQMHGGMGMTDAFDIGLYLKRAKVAGELLGDSSYHGEVFARNLGY